MAIQAGLVGLPNVGKSTLFNALTKSSIPAENFPFCTVDPHVAITNVPDPRLPRLAQIFGSQRQIPTTAQFVDIAGLVKGAAQGEGLGNQFLSNIMGVDVILHVARCFEDEHIVHVHNVVNPVDDLETIFAELLLKDIETVARRDEKMSALIKKSAGNPQQLKELIAEKELLDALKPVLDAANQQKAQELINDAAARGITTVSLLSAKKFLIIANVSEEDFIAHRYVNNRHYQALVNKFGNQQVIPVSAKIEAELVQLPDVDRLEFMGSLGIEESGLDNIIRRTYEHLGLITFFTCGPKEAHAWSIKRGTRVQQAAGEIHTDLERGFICAEVYNATDLFAAGSEQQLKLAGKMRTEGKDYVVQDGDLLNIRFNV